MQLTPPFPPPTVIMKHGIAVENRIQQWLWGNNNKEHRAAWPLPLLAANQSLAPISEHVPQAKLTPHTEQERRGEERRDLVQPHDGSENQPPRSPPLTALLPLHARGLFQTPPHSFSAIHSFLHCFDFFFHNVFLLLSLKEDLQTSLWRLDSLGFSLLLHILAVRKEKGEMCSCLCVYVFSKSKISYSPWPGLWLGCEVVRG